MWVMFEIESIFNSLYRRQVDLQRNNLKLIHSMSPWAYDRSKDLEIKIRLSREQEPKLDLDQETLWYL